MRFLILVVATLLCACAPAPAPIADTTIPSPIPTPPSATTFSFDVENRASIGVVVSVATDAAATMSGFESGQRGTISIQLLNPANGIGVEIQATGCRLLAYEMFPTPDAFTLVVEDGAGAGTVKLSTRPETAARPMPLPSNDLVGCGG